MNLRGSSPFEKLTRFTLDHPRTAIGFAVLLTAAFAFQSRNIRIDTEPENTLDPDQPEHVFHSNVKRDFGVHDLTQAKQLGDSVSVFLMGDAAVCAVAGQTTPNGFYNIERMLKVVVRRGGRVGVCGSCMDARGIGSGALMDGAKRSSLDELTAWTRLADKVLAL